MVTVFASSDPDSYKHIFLFVRFLGKDLLFYGGKKNLINPKEFNTALCIEPF